VRGLHFPFKVEPLTEMPTTLQRLIQPQADGDTLATGFKKQIPIRFQFP